jgi:hypothetical protein
MWAAMTARLWSLNDLSRFLRYEDPEVRYWAADRLSRHYPEAATPLLAPFLFDEHDLTPELVAVHLARHGGPDQFAVLTRGVKTLRGLSAARALEALVRLKAPDGLDLVKAAFSRRDFDEDCWSCVAEALAEADAPPAHHALREFLTARADWAGLPAVLGAALRITEAGGYGQVLGAWIRALQWRGAGSEDLGESFRVLMDHLEIDDCGWCFRTNLKGRIDLPRTVKAIESAYDCELQAALGPDQAALAKVLDGGAYDAIVAAFAEAVKMRARTARSRGDDLAARIAEAAGFWATPEARGAVEGLGPHLRDWITGFLLAALVKMARYRNYALEIRDAGADLDRLLDLLGVETSAMLDDLPAAITRAVEASGATDEARQGARRRVEERCLAMLQSRGPFFPHVVSLETLGELRSTGAIDELLDFLAEDNSYLYEAAEHALSHMDDAFLEAARARLEAGTVDEEAGHSLLILLAELGSEGALRCVLDHFDFFAESAGPADVARWMSLFGARDLIDPLRRLLPRNVAQVGQAILMLAAVHNVRVPEESAIRRAIDDYFKQPPGGEGSGGPAPADGSDKYLM